jgi:hypothetical protein
MFRPCGKQIQRGSRPAQKYSIRAVFLGCLDMTFERIERYPGRSQGYAGLPEAKRRQLAQIVPEWSAFIRREARRFGETYIDTSDEFRQSLVEAEALLIGSPVHPDSPGTMA